MVFEDYLIIGIDLQILEDDFTDLKRHASFINTFSIAKKHR